MAAVQLTNIVEQSHAADSVYIEEEIYADFESLASIWRYHRGTPDMMRQFGPPVDADGNATTIELSESELCLYSILSPHMTKFANGNYSYLSIIGPLGGLLIFNHTVGNHRFCIVPSDTTNGIYEIIFYKL